MACIKSAPRSALVAFAPDAPYLAAGTMAGAVDLSFSSTANLEIFKLDFQSDAHDLPVAGACPSDERFNRLSWGKPPGSSSEEFSLGLVAGGLSDGSIGIWNPLKIIRCLGAYFSFCPIQALIFVKILTLLRVLLAVDITIPFQQICTSFRILMRNLFFICSSEDLNDSSVAKLTKHVGPVITVSYPFGVFI